MNHTTGLFFTEHYFLTTFAKIAGRLYADSNSVFLDFSSKDLHLSTI